LRLTGTKIVCAEGDCGSCSVLVGRPRYTEHGKWWSAEGATREYRLEYYTVDACIQLMFQLDSTHIVTVEGLRTGEILTPVQQAMVDLHGSQCGYCTPGFVVAMTGLLENNPLPSEDEWRCGLAGNLCRCTGYSSILAAGKQAACEAQKRLAELYPDEEMLAEIRVLAQLKFHIQHGRCEVYGPIDKYDAAEYLAANPTAKVVAGGTDVGVQLNKRMIAVEKFLTLNRLNDFQEAFYETSAIHPDGLINCQAGANWTAVEAACRPHVPQFADIISIFGSPQIRNIGTIGGNLVNASPIADSIPFLMVMNAVLLVIRPNFEDREIGINDFYLGYRQTALQPGELLASVTFFLPGKNQQLSLFKVSRRRDLDISTFTAALLLTIENETIQDARIALGAVGPTVLRVKKTEAFLRGKPFTEQTMQAAGELAVEEVTPISDVRGSADFRWQLTRNVFLKFFHQRRSAAAYSA
jgi:xanthine dehydrogenase small subunit